MSMHDAVPITMKTSTYHPSLAHRLDVVVYCRLACHLLPCMVSARTDSMLVGAKSCIQGRFSDPSATNNCYERPPVHQQENQNRPLDCDSDSYTSG